ncbi:flagellar protein FlaG [Alicyclobacillus fastidiosus]|uniref:Flagellar protein FlaG n=1 Tax=Alicyclobacillus fastidiosus TaxID=392011 RepID=A0ABV5AKW1_9BACL|nr:flagellar protein FlaG [Alicyclobacillus fastidiosus]WEH10254.1 flagellar protein FlaG [Alicyclobacillus fastidiosus]
MTVQSLSSSYSNIVGQNSSPSSTSDQQKSTDQVTNNGSENSLGDQTSKLQKTLDDWKQRSIQPNLSVEFDKDTPSNQIWMNLVDNTTGQVIYKFPPEAMRMLAEHKQANGLVTDIRT